jgi:hypothetical protein
VTNPYRKEYRKLEPVEVQYLDEIKDKAYELFKLIDLKSNREASVAKTKLEECVMWAVKGATG